MLTRNDDCCVNASCVLCNVCCLFCGLGDAGGSLQAGLALVSDTCQQLLDFGDRPAGVESFGACLGAVHDCMTPEN